ncbi:MAG: TIM barrel protein [Gemmatimonadota bacterium]
MTSRRSFLAGSAVGLAGVVSAAGEVGAVSRLPGRGISPLRQSVCRWPFGGIPLDEFCAMVKRLGFGAVDLVNQGDWDVVRAHGLGVSTANSSPRGDFIARGLNNPANHATILAELESVIPAAAAAGIPNVIAMFGNRVEGIDDEAAIANCAAGLSTVAPLAERHGVTIILEMLNSRVDHRNFQGDTTAFGVAVAEKVASPRVRLLYDIYHMQIMEGDVIRTIRQNKQWFAHYHTAGNPGRNELNAHQELQYGAIAEAIVATDFGGWLAHEFIPTGDPAAGLTEARDAVRS